jgi:amino acid permease
MNKAKGGNATNTNTINISAEEDNKKPMWVMSIVYIAIFLICSAVVVAVSNNTDLIFKGFGFSGGTENVERE